MQRVWKLRPFCGTPRKMFGRLMVALFLLALAGQSAEAATYRWNNPAGGDFSAADNWSPPGVPGASDTAIIDLAGTYSVFLSTPKTVGPLTIGNSSSGTQTLDTNNTDITSSNATVATRGLLLVNGGTFTTTTLTVNGTVTQNGGTVSTKATGALNVVGGGTFNLNNGTLTFSGVQSIQSGGIFNWSVGVITSSTVAKVTTIFSGGVLNLIGPGQKNLDGSTITNKGSIKWSEASNLQAYNGAIINNENLFDVLFDGDGNIFWGGPGANPTFNNKTGSTFRKQTGTGTLNLQDVNFANMGTVDTKSGILDLAQAFNGVATGGLSTGTFTTASGATTRFGGTPMTWNGVTFNGAGDSQIAGSTITLAGTSTVASSGNLELSSGDLTGPSSLSINGHLLWSGGTMSGIGTTTINSGGIMQLISGAQKNLDTRTLTNDHGLIQWSDASNLQAYNGAVINNQNQGIFEVNFDGDGFIFWGGGGANPTFNNKTGSTFRKVPGGGPGDGTLVLQDVNFANGGTVDTLSGILDLAQAFNGGATGGTSTGGTFNTGTGAATKFGGTPMAWSGVTFSGAGISEITASEITLTGTSTVATGGTLAISGGNLTGTSDLNVSGTLAWSGGAMSGIGTTTINSGGNAKLATAAQKNLDTRTLTNKGTITWLDASNLQAYNGALINNENGGLFDVKFDGDGFIFWGGGGANPTFNNKTGSTFRKQTGTGTLNLQDVNFANGGTVDNKSGILDLAQAFNGGATGGTSTGGTFNTETGATTQFGGTLMAWSGVTFSGAGISDVTSSEITLTGTNTVIGGGRLAISGGNVGGTGDLTINANGTLMWNGGIMSGAGTTTIKSGGVLQLLTGAQKNLDGRTLTNQGAFNWLDASNLQAYNGAIINNEADFNATFPGDSPFSGAVWERIPLSTIN